MGQKHNQKAVGISGRQNGAAVLCKAKICGAIWDIPLNLALVW